MEALGLKPKPGERSKLLWTPAGDEVIVTKGTPQSDWRKTMLRKNGTAAIPRHIQKALTLRNTSHSEEKLIWIRRGSQIVIGKKGMEPSRIRGRTRTPRLQALAGTRNSALRLNQFPQ